MDKWDLESTKLCPYDPNFPLKSSKISTKCDACYEDHHDNKQGYKCGDCGFCLHEECINANITSRHKHPLKLIQNFQVTCCLCHTQPRILYQCSLCSFYICIPCAKKPLIFNQTKAHTHDLLQLPIELSFTCYACGLCTTEYPCFCRQCCFIIHRECIFLPRVIYINRHDHRISQVSSLGPGKWICEVCHDEYVNGEYGAYSCSVCSFVAHSRCATNRSIWDGRELEGIPEEDEKEERKPFEVIDENLIKHFSHEHNLKASLSSSRLEEPREHCYACTIPLYSESCYKCTQCDYILHKSCANLPLKKRHETSTRKLTLCSNRRAGVNYFRCQVCRRFCTGFSYNDDDNLLTIDVRCAFISGAIKHDSHPHWLFVILDSNLSCDCCGLYYRHCLRCKDKDNCGGYNLCFRCATLPTPVRHKYDDHPLFLCYGEKNVNVTYCCEICEEEIYSESWLYKCDECSSTFHSECVFKNLIHFRPGYSLAMGKKGSFDLLPSSNLSRPICYLCKIRCMEDLVLKKKSDKNIFICCSCGFTFNFIEGPRRLSDSTC